MAHLHAPVADIAPERHGDVVRCVFGWGVWLLLASFSPAAGANIGSAESPAAPRFETVEPAAAGGRSTVDVYGDWTLDRDRDDQDVHLRVHGDIRIPKGVRWTMNNCELTLMCEHARQYRVYWEGGELVTRDCVVGGFHAEGRSAQCNFEVKDGLWDATDTTVQYCYAVSVSGRNGGQGELRGTRFLAGPSPDAIIVSGSGRVSLKESRYPIALGLHVGKGGEAKLDLPTGVPMTRLIDAAKVLNGGATYTVDLMDTEVPHWFLFVRDLSPTAPAAEIVVERCENFLLSLLGRDWSGLVTLSSDLAEPVRIGPVTIRRGNGEVGLRMYGGLYFSGENDVTVGGAGVVAETMCWGGSVRIDGGPDRAIQLKCTTMDVKGGELEVSRVQLGSDRGGQIIAERQGRVVARDVELGRLLLRTEGEGRISIDNYQATAPLRFQSGGGEVVLSGEVRRGESEVAPAASLQAPVSEPEADRKVGRAQSVERRRRAVLRRSIRQHDTAVELFDARLRDPFILRGPDDAFYLTGTTAGSHWGDAVGIQLWRSYNLVDWEDLGLVWDLNEDGVETKSWHTSRKAKEGVKNGCAIWAPELHFMNGTWWVPHSVNIAGHGLLKSVSGKPEGPYLAMPPVADQGIDAHLFQDMGKTYYLWGADNLTELDQDFRPSGPVQKLRPSGTHPLGYEGVLLRKIDDKYLLCASGRYGYELSDTYDLYYCTSDSLLGPYGPRRMAVKNAGHGNLFQDRQNRWWCTAFDHEFVTSSHRWTPWIVPIDLVREGEDLHVAVLDQRFRPTAADQAQVDTLNQSGVPPNRTGKLPWEE